MSNVAAPREHVCEQNVGLPEEGLVAFTSGNASRHSGDLMAIKPSGVPYAYYGKDK